MVDGVDFMSNLETGYLLRPVCPKILPVNLMGLCIKVANMNALFLATFSGAYPGFCHEMVNDGNLPI